MALSICILLLQLTVNCAEPLRSRTAQLRQASHRQSQRLVNIQRVTRNDQNIYQHSQPFQHGAISDVRASSEIASPTSDGLAVTEHSIGSSAELLPIQEQISSFILAPSDLLTESIADLPDFGTTSVTVLSESSEPENPALPSIQQGDVSVVAVAEADTKSTHELVNPVSPADMRVETEPFPTILVNTPPPTLEEEPIFQSPTVPDVNPVELPLSYPPVRVPIVPAALPPTIAPIVTLPLEPTISSVTSTDNVEMSLLLDAPNLSTEVAPLKVEETVNTEAPQKSSVDPAPGAQVLAQHVDKQQSLYQVLPPFYGILYPVPPPHPSTPLSPQVQFEHAQYRPSAQYAPSSYGPPRDVYANNQESNAYRPRRPFGIPPTPRALGFPPVSNTHDNMHNEVNWARVGRVYRSA